MVIKIVFVMTFSLNVALAQPPYIKPEGPFFEHEEALNEAGKVKITKRETKITKIAEPLLKKAEIVKILLTRKVKLNFKRGGGNTLLHHAAGGGYVDIVKILLKKGADRNLKNDCRRRPVAYSKNNEIVSILGKDDFVIESEKAFNNRIKITKTFDYLVLWPEDTSVLFVGEYHYVPQFKAEVARLIERFKKSNVGITHYATEFITKREQSMMDVYQYTPLPREKFNEYLRVKGEYAIVDKAAKESKVKIIGLAVDIIGDMTLKWGASDEGLKERNKEWVKILMKILKEKPKAKMLVYSGVGHSMYSYDVKPVSTMLKEKGIKVKVLELAGPFSRDSRFCNMRDAYTYTAERLGVQDEHFAVVVPKNKTQLLGADFIINVPKTEKEPSYILEELIRPTLLPWESPSVDYKNK